MSQEQFAELLQRVNEMETENKKKTAELESRNAELQRRIEEKEAGVKEWEVAGRDARGGTHIFDKCLWWRTRRKSKSRLDQGEDIDPG